jgi:hypothetical protein
MLEVRAILDEKWAKRRKKLSSTAKELFQAGIILKEKEARNCESDSDDSQKCDN